MVPIAEIIFEPDPQIQEIAEAYATDAVDCARNHFELDLDWSDSGICHIETMLQRFHQELDDARPSEEKIFQFAKLFGNYVGEVFRRNHGGHWGMVTMGGESFPGIKADHSEVRFWPYGRVHNRLVNGPEDNVWHYYQALVERCSRGPLSSTASNQPKPS